MSNTPETDASRGYALSSTPETDDFELNLGDYSNPWKAIEFARKLERERDEAREKAERYRIEANAIMMQRDEWAAMCGRYKQERDEARFLLKQAQSSLDAIHLEVGGWIKIIKENTD